MLQGYVIVKVMVVVTTVVVITVSAVVAHNRSQNDECRSVCTDRSQHDRVQINGGLEGFDYFEQWSTGPNRTEPNDPFGEVLKWGWGGFGQFTAK